LLLQAYEREWLLPDNKNPILDVFQRHRRVWERKPVLRRVYREEFFARLHAFRNPHGISIEVGAGPGFFKEFLPEVVATDFMWSPWVNVMCDAQLLPFRASSISNVFGVDVLHHLAEPMTFLFEAERILVRGGRVILVEPWITPFSYLVYRYLHQEGCDLSARPWESTVTGSIATKHAMDGNPAVPYLVFGDRNRAGTLARLPKLKLLNLEPFCLFAYLLSLGFKSFSLLPVWLYGPLSAFESRTSRLWRSVAALRVLIVLEKRCA
jgi:Methyltransferase domain